MFLTFSNKYSTFNNKTKQKNIPLNNHQIGNHLEGRFAYVKTLT